MESTTREKLKAYVRKNEGLRLHPYKCSMGKWTWGYGHNFQDNPFTLDQIVFILSSSIPDAIEYVFDADINIVIAEMEKNWPFMDNLCPARQVACADLIFNMGLGTFKGFNLLLGALKVGNYPKAAQELKSSLYANQVGLRAANNALMISSGEFA